MADVEERVALNTLLDFYGPLLTEHRREIVRLYCEEDLSLSEIAEQLGITRQGVSDALSHARRQLAEYERKLGLAERYRGIRAAAEAGLKALEESGTAPEPVRLAVMLMVSHYYENRDNPERAVYGTMRIAFENLLYPYRDLEKMF